MNQEEKNYFGDIVKLRTPKMILGQDYASYTQMCELYCQIKNLARDVLLIPNLNPENIKKTIEEKLERIQILGVGFMQLWSEAEKKVAPQCLEENQKKTRGLFLNEPLG